MFEALRRIIAPERRRSLDAAAGGRRWSDAPAATTATLPTGFAMVRQRAAYASRNQPWAGRAVNAWSTALVAEHGIRPQSMHRDPEQRRVVDSLFAAWSVECDAGGRSNFAGIQAAVCRSMVEQGEAFVRLRQDGLQLQVLDPAQIDSNAYAAGFRVEQGIEFDAGGRRTAYYVLPDANAVQPVRVPAEDVCHVFEPLAAGQVRGIPWLAPVLLKLKDLDSYTDAQLMRQKVGALHTGFLYSPDGSAGPYGGDTAGGVLESGMEPGTLKVLPAGFDVKFSDPPELGQEFDAFQRWILREIAAGIGLPYEALTGDLSSVNYSSICAGLVEFRRRVDALRAQVLIPQLLQPVWRRFIDTAILSGALPADDPDIGAVSWIAPAWRWVDPLKDAEAEVLAIANGLRSRAEVVAEHGRDIEELDRERAEDRRREQSLGLMEAADAD